MDHTGQTARTGASDDTHTRERLTRLEEQFRLTISHDRQWNHQAREDLREQIASLRAEMRVRGYGTPLSAWAWWKLLAALVLPFAAFVMSGSLESAIHVSERTSKIIDRIP